MAGTKRLSADARRRQLVEAAAELILKQGFLPVSPERLARAAGVSKALVYAYFPGSHDLYNAVLDSEFQTLGVERLAAAARQGDLAQAAAACADLYFLHVAEHGPVAHVVLRDVHMSRGLRPDLAAQRDLVARRLAGLARRQLQLSAKDAVAAYNLIMTIPEESGRLVWEGDLDIERGRDLVRRLVTSSIEALRPS
ncbi:MAG TPA: TetR/AcrR family transcriptional regulator [Phenylobacterium sp.]|nr:TetR/AcrR family transcriptional regulator [Phenylobacterium sp.]